MRGLIFIALCIRLLVIFMLLLCTNQLCGRAMNIRKLLAGIGISFLYALLCMKPDLYFLGNRLWYFVFTVLVAFATFGMERSSLRPITVFLLINLILDSIATDRTDLVSGVISVVGLVVLYLIGFWEHSETIVPVQLVYKDKQVHISALRDTGNRLVDPVTGKPILIVGADVAKKLTGLTDRQLAHPVETVGLLPGLRLIPYSTIGKQGSFLLAMRIQEVKIGKRKSNGLVAFAPVNIGAGESYQALTGGIL